MEIIESLFRSVLCKDCCEDPEEKSVLLLSPLLSLMLSLLLHLLLSPQHLRMRLLLSAHSAQQCEHMGRLPKQTLAAGCTGPSTQTLAEGRRPLAPALSPKKTWAGLWGGLVSCTLFTWSVLAWVHLQYRELSASVWALLMMISLLLAVYAVVGDLFESMLKRHRGIKDSGRTLPGHGGILDRIDSLLAATPVFVLGIALLSRVLEVI